MDLQELYAVILLASLIHASFQLSVSMLTLLSSHTIGAKRSRARLFSLTSGFTGGAFFMTVLLLSVICLLLMTAFALTPPPIAWAVSSGLAMGVGIAVWVFYYRQDQGTTLWLPRSLARFLSERTRKTTLAAETFSLGLASVVAEIVFIIAPLIIAGLTICLLPADHQFPAILLYAFVSSLPLIIVTMRVNAGRSLAAIQRWRENNKRFIQFAAGSALMVLGFYLYVSEVSAVIQSIRLGLNG